MTAENYPELPASLSAAEAARLLDVTEEAVVSALRTGRLPSFNSARGPEIPTARVLPLIGATGFMVGEDLYDEYAA